MNYLYIKDYHVINGIRTHGEIPQSRQYYSHSIDQQMLREGWKIMNLIKADNGFTILL